LKALALSTIANAIMSQDNVTSFVDELVKSEYRHAIDIQEKEDGSFWFNARDIGKVVGISNIRSRISSFPDSDKHIFEKETKGGNQHMVYISYNAVARVLTNSRKENSIKLSKFMSIKTIRRKFTCIEMDTIKCIKETFNGEEMHEQYAIAGFYIDLYFTKYKIAIECDEKRHNVRKIKKSDIQREQNITTMIPSIYFLRYTPEEKGFNMFHVLNNIYKAIQLQFEKAQ
jgi:very-short-patch-repair endonuclease